jgi:hypothetical protein
MVLPVPGVVEREKAKREHKLTELYFSNNRLPAGVESNVL